MIDGLWPGLMPFADMSIIAQSDPSLFAKDLQPIANIVENPRANPEISPLENLCLTAGKNFMRLFATPLRSELIAYWSARPRKSSELLIRDESSLKPIFVGSCEKRERKKAASAKTAKKMKMAPIQNGRGRNREREKSRQEAEGKKGEM